MKIIKEESCCSPFQATPDNIYWERDFEDGEDLLERLQGIEVIMRQPQGLPLRLLVIDSIAHLFRDVGDRPDTSAYVHRTGMLFRISALLRRFADTYNIAVVVTNQVCMSAVVLVRVRPAAQQTLCCMQAQVMCGWRLDTALLVPQVSDAFTDDDILTKKQAPACKHTGGLRLLSSGRELVPALGLAWANCVNTRLFLSRTEVIVASPQCHSNSAAFCGPEHIPYSVSLRYMQVVFSPCLPPDTCLFVVTQHGLQGVDNSKITQERQDHTHRYVDRQMARHPLAAQQPGLQPPGVGGDAMPQNIAEAVHLHQQGATLATGVFAAKSLSKPCGLSHAKFKLVKTIHQ